MKKKLSLIIVLATLLTSFASCSESGSNESESTQKENTPSESTSAGESESGETETERIPLGLSTDLDFDGYNMRVLTYNAATGDSFITDISGDLVNDKLYNRDRAVEKLLDIKLTPSAYETEGPDYAKLEKLIKANEDAYDFLHLRASTYYANRPTYELNMLNLADDANLNLDAPWWNTEAINELSYNGKSKKYLIGDISLSSISGASVIFYNKNLFNDIYHNPDTPYTDVIEGKWTVDKFSEYCSGAYQDTDGNGTRDENDFWGTMINPWLLQSMYNGFSDTRFYTRDENGLVQLDLDTDRVMTFAEKLYSLVRQNDGVLYLDGNNEWHNNAQALFANDKMLFLAYFLNSVEKEEFRSMESDYGILPFFKLDENQQEYRSDLNPSGTNWITVPTTCREVEKTTATLEALSYYSYYDVTPVYYEQALKTKYTRDQQSGMVLDIVRDSIRTDYLIGIYRSTIGQHFVINIRDNDQNYISGWEKQVKVYNKTMAKNYASLDDAE